MRAHTTRRDRPHGPSAAHGLDATPLIQRKPRATGAPDALAARDILDIILRDGIGHVAIGNHWYRSLCARQDREPLTHDRQLARTHRASPLKGPFNLAARRRAGFSVEKMAEWSAPARDA